MTGCVGYACPPEHSVPSSTVVVVPTSAPSLPDTGGAVDPTLGILGVVAIVIGAFLTITRRRTTRPRRNP